LRHGRAIVALNPWTTVLLALFPLTIWRLDGSRPSRGYRPWFEPGNRTGSQVLQGDLIAKRLELLEVLVASLSRVAFLQESVTTSVLPQLRVRMLFPSELSPPRSRDSMAAGGGRWGGQCRVSATRDGKAPRHIGPEHPEGRDVGSGGRPQTRADGGRGGGVAGPVPARGRERLARAPRRRRP